MDNNNMASLIDHDVNQAASLPEQKVSQRFRDLPFPARTATPVITPLVAEAWAESIVRFWEISANAGGINPAKPLYLLDLFPGEGSQVWLLLRALHQRVDISTCHFCYVACSEDQDSLHALASHPYLADDIAARRFDSAAWNGSDHTLTLRAQGVTMMRTDNPLVVLSANRFASLPSDLYAIHQGKIVEGRVIPKAAENSPNELSIEYDWQTVDAEAVEASPHRLLLQHYLKRFTGTPFLIPAPALDILDAIDALSAGRYLLLSADHGCHTEQQMRLCRMAPPKTCSDENQPLPVNYHALSIHQQQQGAWTWNHQLHDDGMILHAACRSADIALDDEIFATLIAPLHEAHPDDAAALSISADNSRGQSAATILSLLRLSRHDPRVLQASLPTLLAQASSIVNTARSHWQSALSSTWSNYLPPFSANAFVFDLALFAMELGHWELAKHALHTDLSLYGEHPTSLHHLAWCEAVTGNLGEAMELISLALEIDPEHQQVIALHRSLAERSELRASTAWFHADIAHDGDLWLEPLGQEHADYLFYQYRDPQISEMTRLPELKTLQETSDWISEQGRDESRHSYAIVHRHWGPIGLVGMRWANEAGYFYFWIGADFQDRGWGKQAANLMFKQALRNDIATMFTSVYEDNSRSQDALARLGFSALNLKALEPDHDLIFLHVPLTTEGKKSTEAIEASFRTLCQAIECPFVFTNELRN